MLNRFTGGEMQKALLSKNTCPRGVEKILYGVLFCKGKVLGEGNIPIFWGQLTLISKLKSKSNKANFTCTIHLGISSYLQILCVYKTENNTEKELLEALCVGICEKIFNVGKCFGMFYINEKKDNENEHFTDPSGKEN